MNLQAGCKGLGLAVAAVAITGNAGARDPMTPAHEPVGHGVPVPKQTQGDHQGAEEGGQVLVPKDVLLVQPEGRHFQTMLDLGLVLKGKE